MNREKVGVLLVSILLLSTMLTLLVTARDVGKLRKRIVALEQICHGLCRFGDDDCNARCQKAGHCPMQDQ